MRKDPPIGGKDYLLRSGSSAFSRLTFISAKARMYSHNFRQYDAKKSRHRQSSRCLIMSFNISQQPRDLEFCLLGYSQTFSDGPASSPDTRSLSQKYSIVSSRSSRSSVLLLWIFQVIEYINIKPNRRAHK